MRPSVYAQWVLLKTLSDDDEGKNQANAQELKNETVSELGREEGFVTKWLLVVFMSRDNCLTAFLFSICARNVHRLLVDRQWLTGND